MSITLIPQEATVQLFLEMEAYGVIKRLVPVAATETPCAKTPCAETSCAEQKANHVELCYETPAIFGGHKLIYVTVFEDTLTRLTSHPHHEEFLLLGSEHSRPLVLIISKHKHEVLEAKRSAHQISADDFFCFYVKMNNPAVSFFTMIAGYPHAELCVRHLNEGVAPSFFVTEAAQLPEILMPLNNNEIILSLQEELIL